jgi:hypothetical protein
VVDFLPRIGRGAPIHGPPFDGGGLLAVSRFEVTERNLRLVRFAVPIEEHAYA